MIFFTVNICDLLRKETKQVNLHILAFSVLSLVLTFVLGAELVKFADSFLGVGIALFLFSNLYFKIGFSKSIGIFAIYEFCYGLARKFVFIEYFEKMFNMENFEAIFTKEIYSDYPNFAREFTNISNIYLDNMVAIWTLPIIFAFFGGVLIGKKNPLVKIQSIAFKIPDFVVYLLMIAMGLAIFPETRFVGLPLTLTIALLLSIQGFPIVWFWLLRSTYKNTLLRTLTYLIIFINFHVFVAISTIIGLIDIWFNLKNGVQK